MSLLQELIRQAKIRKEIAESNFNNAEDGFVDKAVEELKAAELALEEICKLAWDCGRSLHEKKS